MKIEIPRQIEADLARRSNVRRQLDAIH
jgi:hypothetical protein